MSETKKPTNTQIFLFFIGFVTLFTLVFVLGIIVGKGLSNKGVADLDPNMETQSETAGTDTDIETDLDADENEFEPGVYEDDVFVKKEDKPALDNETEKDVELVEKETEAQEQNKEIDEKENPEKKTEIKEEKEPENELGYVKKTETAKLPPDTLPPTDPEGKYTVQVGSFKEINGAEKIVNQYKSKGYPAFIKTVEIDQAQKWYRVRIGTFSTREVAKNYFEVLKAREKNLNGFITTNQ